MTFAVFAIILKWLIAYPLVILHWVNYSKPPYIHIPYWVGVVLGILLRSCQNW